MRGAHPPAVRCQCPRVAARGQRRCRWSGVPRGFYGSGKLNWSKRVAMRHSHQVQQGLALPGPCPRLTGIHAVRGNPLGTDARAGGHRSEQSDQNGTIIESRFLIRSGAAARPASSGQFSCRTSGIQRSIRAFVCIGVGCAAHRRKVDSEVTDAVRCGSSNPPCRIPALPGRSRFRRSAEPAAYPSAPCAA
jgi:hypothetical protein